jgi:phage FluMu protein Com
MPEFDNASVLRYAASFGIEPAKLLPRQVVREVACPRCKALVNQPCWNNRLRKGTRIRSANHLERCFERIRIEMEKSQWTG